jgi:histidyl-tRNA synthetase
VQQSDQPFQAPKGTHDVLPPESARWQRFLACFAGHAERAGYGLIQQPMFEQLGVFHRMGEGTDVVRKEMYDFVDKGGEHIALRPEGTASVVRAYVQHHPLPPWKVWYAAPSFRYERPQKGRVRQHHQVGIEAIGPADPDLDVEVITLLWDFYRALGLRQVRLAVNSMGDIEGRHAYLDELRGFLRAHAGDLDPDDAEKIESFPMRVLDTKRPRSIPVAEAAPKLLDNLSDVARAHFERVQAGLLAQGIEYEIDPRLVRGLDYYTHTTFEFQSTALDAAQSTIGGGGRYDGLVESLGGDPTPGIGFGCGIERTLLACDHEGVFDAPESSLQVFVVDVVDGTAARDLTHELRRAGLSADRAWDGRSMKAQMKQANRSGAAIALIVGSDEAEQDVVTVRHLRDARAQEQIPRADVVAHLADLAQIASPDAT